MDREEQLRQRREQDRSERSVETPEQYWRDEDNKVGTYVHHTKKYNISLLELHIRLVHTFITQNLPEWFTGIQYKFLCHVQLIN